MSMPLLTFDETAFASSMASNSSAINIGAVGQPKDSSRAMGSVERQPKITPKSLFGDEKVIARTSRAILTRNSWMAFTLEGCDRTNASSGEERGQIISDSYGAAGMPIPLSAGSHTAETSESPPAFDGTDLASRKRCATGDSETELPGCADKRQ